MTLVVDASALVSAVVDSGREGRWSAALVAGHDLAAPELVLAEAANILRRLEGAGRISQLEATSAHRDVLRP